MNTILFIAAGILGLILVILISLPDIKGLIAIRRTPTRKINTLELKGEAEIIGNVISNNKNGNINSPLTQKTCELWQVEIQQEITNPNGTYLKTIYKQTSKEPFEISDGTGRSKIFPLGANLVLRDDTEEVSPLDSRIKSAMEILGVQTSFFPGLDYRFRVYERVIKPGDKIYILGAFSSDNGLKKFEAATDIPLIISDYTDRDLLIQQRFFGIFVKILFGIFVVLLGCLYIIRK